MSSSKIRHITRNHVFTFGLDHLSTAVEAFIIDRQSSGLSPNTIQFYRNCLRRFIQFCDSQAITQIDQVAPDTIRAYLLWLEQNGHNPSGRHAHYRTLRAFMFWLESELGEDTYRAPIRKVKPPKVPKEIIEGVSLDDVQRMIDACKGNRFTDLRDKALLLFLLDTGTRASEALAIDLADVDFATGGVLIRKGKGNKSRMVYFGRNTRRAITAYLKSREDDHPALWVNEKGERLTRYGLDKTLRLRAKQAGITNPPSAHDFRRAFALNMLRSGCDVFTLQRLMGHSDLTVLRRYLAQNENDLQQAHQRFSPVENLTRKG
ncbi:MAG: tyrosine-type recombinase/integrase [Thermanaerothrix sp.]|uniref:Tyrosine-type recombinase/integrase n=1 Tax=Thermanaerothrix solaris TaxID=3058434 RepID=A0ABU3NLC8_9CHLR|nr:tyrosine-type recombinase/integrase [Thermanaerothrix sp. 4228-RoL]MDT8896777.1 tyrosine-type recombinase/integrase [Thermanaerothrix sp. 4228-RoL]